MNIDIETVPWRGPADEPGAIRRDVFVVEQGVPEALEWDDADATARHWLARVEGKPVGTVRLLADGHIGRVAVRGEWRHRGVGSRLIEAVLSDARAEGRRDLYLNAQLTAIGFYERLGFSAAGPVFDDAGIPHRTMRLLLKAPTLGAHGGRFAAADRAALGLDLALQARRQLRLLSNALKPALWDTDAFAEAVSQLARRHRHCEVRLLLLDGRTVAQRGHRLLDLHRRLPTAVAIRRLALPPADTPENFLLADDCGILCYNVREPEQAWGDYYNVPVVETYRRRFDEWWHRSSADPELRLLSI